MPLAPARPIDRGRGRFLLACLLGAGVYGLLGMLAVRGAALPRSPKLVVTANVQLQRPRAPPPVPPPPPVETPPAPPARPTRQARRSTLPPAAAAAGKVVARAASPDQPLDFTGFDMVVGKGDVYRGGYTAAAGTSQAAVETPLTTPHGTEPPEASRARPAAPARKDWACAWPEDAQDTDIRDARTSIRVHVDRDGEAQGVDIVSAPSPSFAEAARRCAMAETYRMALNDAGQSTAGITPLFIVHFVR